MTETITDIEAPAPGASAGKRLKFLIGGGVIAIAIIYLIFTATQSTAAYFLTVEELYARGSEVYDRNVRVSGKVVEDGIDFNARDLVLRFQVAGQSGQTLPVVFNGPKPDQLRADAEAVLEGRFDGRQFSAQTLLLKCPSKYEEEKGVVEQKVEAVR
jgi:cytochrome c-type biogenesis protein CcmE